MNTFTGEKTWFKPPEVDLFDVEPQKPNEATKWVEEWDTTAGAYFYYNTRTGEYRWEKPADFDVDLGEGLQGEGLDWFETKKSHSTRRLEDGTISNTDEDATQPEEDQETTDSSQDYLASQPRTGRVIYAWEELVDEESERTYYFNSETGETRWSLPPHEALAGESGLRATQALIAENPLWGGVSGDKIYVPPTGAEFLPVTLEDSVVVSPDIEDAESTEVAPTDSVSENAFSEVEQKTNYDDDNSRVTHSHSDEAALPDGWEEVHDDETGANFYYNEATGESTWDRPVLKRLQALAATVAAFTETTNEDSQPHSGLNPDVEDSPTNHDNTSHDGTDRQQHYDSYDDDNTGQTSQTEYLDNADDSYNNSQTTQSNDGETFDETTNDDVGTTSLPDHVEECCLVKTSPLRFLF